MRVSKDFLKRRPDFSRLEKRRVDMFWINVVIYAAVCVGVLFLAWKYGKTIEGKLDIFLLSLFLPFDRTEKPYLNLRRKGAWIFAGCFLSFLSWKLTGYVILNPVWSVIGAFLGLCFFAMSYLLKLDIDRHG